MMKFIRLESRSTLISLDRGRFVVMHPHSTLFVGCQLATAQNAGFSIQSRLVTDTWIQRRLLLKHIFNKYVMPRKLPQSFFVYLSHYTRH